MNKDLQTSVAGIAMETETIQKNGVSPKDLIKRRRNNLLSKQGVEMKRVLISVLCLFIAISASVGQTLKRDSESNKYGYVNENGQWVIKPVFDDANEFYYYVDENGQLESNNLNRQKIPRRKDVAKGATDLVNDRNDQKIHSKSIAEVTVNGKEGVIRTDGSYLIEPIYNSVDIRRKYILVDQPGKGAGLLNFDGTYFIEPQYDKEGSSLEYLASGQSGFSYEDDSKSSSSSDNEDGSGKTIYVYYYTVRKDDKFGIIDSVGKYILEPKYDALIYTDVRNSISLFGVITECTENLEKRRYFGMSKEFCLLWGVVDFSGNVVIKPAYIDHEKINEKGYALKDARGNWTSFDKNGKILIEYGDKADRLGFNWYMKDGLSGLLDYRTGKILTPALYSNDFWSGGGESGLATAFHWNKWVLSDVQRDGKYGFIDTTGREVIEAKYENISENGMADNPCVDQWWWFAEELELQKNELYVRLIPAKLNGKWGYIDTQGKVVIDFKYFEAKDFDNNMLKDNKKPLANVILNDSDLTEGYIDAKGNFSKNAEDLQK
jgi:hypothetical protein